MTTPKQRLQHAHDHRDALAGDIPTLEALHQQRLVALRQARADGADLADLERMQSAVSTVAAMLDTTRADLDQAEQDIADAALALDDHNAERAKQRAHARFYKADQALRDIADNFSEVIEEPQRRVANAVVEALEAHQEAIEHGIDARPPRLTRYVRHDDYPNARGPWLRQVLDNIDRLARNTYRERRKAAVATIVEADQAERVREARKKMLRRLRERGAIGDQDRRAALEAEVGADLDRDLAAEAVA